MIYMLLTSKSLFSISTPKYGCILTFSKIFYHRSKILPEVIRASVRLHFSLKYHGFIANQNNDQLPVGLLAQLIEHCTGIAEVMGSNPVQV